MGHCTSDIYKTAKRQYGENFQKLIVQEQSILKLREWVRVKEQQFDAKLTQKKQILHKEVDHKEGSLQNNFLSARISLQSQMPYGVVSFEQMSKKSLEQLLGLDEYKKKFQHAHNLIDSEAKKIKENYYSKAKQLLKKLQEDNKMEQEKLKTFHDLPQEKKTVIVEKGVKEFQPQIDARIKQLENANEKELNYDCEIQGLENVISLKELDDTVKRSQNEFKAEISHMIGNKLDSTIQV